MVFGFVVKEYCEQPSNFRSDMTLDAFMKLKGIPALPILILVKLRVRLEIMVL